MNKFDGRKLHHQTLEELRIRAVHRVEAGESPETVIHAPGFHRRCIYQWIAKYREGGPDALRAKPDPGKKPNLDGRKLAWLYETIVGKIPLQLWFEFALRTRGMVHELIKQQWGIGGQATGARFTLNLISAIDGRDSMCFMVLEGRFTGDMFIRFLKRLMHDAKRPIFFSDR
ncbi:MAG: helix-turn-helix domain-containing protein [Magnetococcus sp. WYHC-3]